LRELHTREHRALILALRRAREDAGLSQEQLAKLLDKPQSYVSKYEKAERGLSVIAFLRIARAIHVDACEILNQIGL
jgi:transcriptional regulator with XRE-family HTH domain